MPYIIPLYEYLSKVPFMKVFCHTPLLSQESSFKCLFSCMYNPFSRNILWGSGSPHMTSGGLPSSMRIKILSAARGWHHRLTLTSGLKASYLRAAFKKYSDPSPPRNMTTSISVGPFVAPPDKAQQT